MWSRGRNYRRLSSKRDREAMETAREEWDYSGSFEVQHPIAEGERGLTANLIPLRRMG